jgi:hypothetical protein
MSEKTHDGHTELTDTELRVRALESLLTEKGLVDQYRAHQCLKAET